MRIAIHNHYGGQEVAETEFSRKIYYAASKLGWEAAEVGSSVEIKRFNPDFVLALHFRTPKLTKYPTYGSMVSPPAYFAHDDQFVKNILSYDGYLSSSDHISSWLKDILYPTQKKHFIAPWYTSCHKVPYRPPQITKPRLLYTGTNWDGPRHRELFERLDAEPYVDIHGPTNAWCYLKRSYRGLLPFDGVSMLDALHSAGVGLCLHRKEHCEAATPSSRIFEIAASGAIAICQDHPFIRENFGDAVLYIDAGQDAADVIAQISGHMRWITENQKQALNLSQRAYEIFSNAYTLEKLLSDLVPHHEKLLAPKKVRHSPSGVLGNETVQFIVRVGERKAEYVERALASLATQIYGPVGAIIVKYGEVPGLSELLRKYDHQLGVTVVNSSSMGLRSTHLWAGLRAVSSQYFGILDDDDVIHPNHVASLLQLLKTSEDCGVAYSGSIRIWESRDTNSESESSGKLPLEPAELALFEPFDLNRLVTLDNFITSNAFIARSTLLKDLGDDPYLPVLEDLFLLLYLCRKTNFVFSYEPTCEFYWRHDRKDNSVLQDRRDWVTACEQIKNLLWKQSFHSTQSLAHNLPQLEQKLSGLEERLAQTNTKFEGKLAQVETTLAQTNTKFEVVTNRLNRYLNFPLIDAVRRFRRMLLRLPPPSNS